MKKFNLVLLFAVFVLNSCQVGSAQNSNSSVKIAPKEFAQQISNLPNSPIIDVRTPGEYADGHIENAVNVDWNSPEFEKTISQYDKTQAIFIYCLSGGRSGAAHEYMKKAGFTKIIELEGGMMKWRSQGMPETKMGTVSEKKGMSVEEFNKIIDSDQLVLIDFYAEWCVPCKKMEPYLNEISTEMAGKVKVVRIDVDVNKDLCAALKIEALPVLQLYKKKLLLWNHLGFIEKAEVVAKINQ